MAPKRIRRSRAKGWRMPPNAVYVGRPGPWGNPFIVGIHGNATKCYELYVALLGGHLCITAGNMEQQEAVHAHVKEHINELRGHDLACWCGLDNPCHVDILLVLANK